MFVQVNNQILDREELVRKQVIVRNHIILSFCDVMNVNGFKQTRKGFVNKDLNMKLTLHFENLDKEVRV